MPDVRKFAAYALHGKDPFGYQRESGTVMSVESEQHAHLRKGTPASSPHKRTLKWMENLPADVRPTVLLRRYARVANLIAAAWPDPRVFRFYMDSLLNDRRGVRQGFPSEVQTELIALKRHYEACTGVKKSFVGVRSANGTD